jgi:hypothetical protein
MPLRSLDIDERPEFKIMPWGICRSASVGRKNEAIYADAAVNHCAVLYQLAPINEAAVCMFRSAIKRPAPARHIVLDALPKLGAIDFAIHPFEPAAESRLQVARGQMHR